jgi:alanine racemase
MTNSVLEIDLSALAENVRQIRTFLSPGTRLCAVVKADAYGLGAARIAPELERLGVGWMAVYDPPQAEEILRAGVSGNILVLMPVMEIEAGPPLESAAKAGRVHWTVHSMEQLRALAAMGKQWGIALPVHVEIDTGMSRGGQLPEAAKELISEIGKTPNVSLAGVFTHASSADTDAECTATQAAAFDRAIADVPARVVHHLANTWATLANKRHHRGMVRIGLGLWGYPSGTWESAERNGVHLRPVVRWVSSIVHVKNVQAGSDVGYNRTFRTSRPTRIGIVPVGYADGYPLLLSNRGVVRVGPALQPVPVIGRVNMDQLIVDLTDAPTVGLESIAELICNDPTAPNAMHKLAEMAQSHPYEMLCRISPRVSRRYLENSSNVTEAAPPARSA